MSEETAWLAFLFLTVALLYASIGQAGASGYLTAMGLFQLAPATMTVTALSLNLLVAATVAYQFWRSGLLSWRTLYPFGNPVFPRRGRLPEIALRYILAAILLASGIKLILT